jgi:hypothetical protein
VRLEFGPESLAIKRINELDRETMNKIKTEAIDRFLPSDVAPQVAWNHAMNSLRQLRHRQCKKIKSFEEDEEVKTEPDVYNQPI